MRKAEGEEKLKAESSRLKTERKGKDRKDEGRWTMGDGRKENKRDPIVYRKVILSSLFLAKRSSFVHRFS